MLQIDKNVPVPTNAGQPPLDGPSTDEASLDSRSASAGPIMGSSLSALADIDRDKTSPAPIAHGDFAQSSISGMPLRRSDSITNGAQAHAAILAGSSIPEQHQKSMLDALAHIGALNLLRANRSDVARELEGTVVSIAKGIGFQRVRINLSVPRGTAKLSDTNEQKRRFAEACGKAYAGTQRCEAYCGEHAYLLLDELLKGGMPQKCLVPIVMFAPAGKGSREDIHCALLYCSKELPCDDLLKGLALRDYIEANLGDCVVLDAWRKEDKVVILSQVGDFQAYCQSVMREVEPHYHGSAFRVRADPLYAWTSPS